MKTRMLTVLGVSALLSFSTGCSVFRPSHQTLSVTVTEPEHAKIWINGNYEGEAHAEVSVLRNKAAYVMVKKDGFQPLQRMVQSNLNTTGLLDAIGTYLFLLPGIGLIAPGSHSLEETTLELRLGPEVRSVTSTNTATVSGP